jgi:hypothetical protein
MDDKSESETTSDRELSPLFNQRFDRPREPKALLCGTYRVFEGVELSGGVEQLNSKRDDERFRCVAGPLDSAPATRWPDSPLRCRRPAS